MANTCLSDIKILGAPRYSHGKVWFVGENNALYRLPLDKPADAIQVPGVKINCDPSPAPNGDIFYFGMNTELMMVQRDAPFLHGRIGDHVSLSQPVSPGGPHVYFRGAGNALMRASLTDPKDMTTYPVTTSEAPAPVLLHNLIFYVAVVDPYPAPTYGGLYCINATKETDRTKSPQDYTATLVDSEGCRNTPYASNNGNLYYADGYNAASKRSLNNLNAVEKTVSMYIYHMACLSTPKPMPGREENRFYIRSREDMLGSISIPDIHDISFNLRSPSPPEPIKDAILYRGMDDKLYKFDV